MRGNASAEVREGVEWEESKGSSAVSVTACPCRHQSQMAVRQFAASHTIIPPVVSTVRTVRILRSISMTGLIEFANTAVVSKLFDCNCSSFL